MPHKIALHIQLDTDFGRNKIMGILRHLQTGVDWEFCTQDAKPFLTIDQIEREKPDGIIGEFFDLATCRRVKKLGVPVVNTSAAVPTSGIPTVCIDAQEIGRLAARHFLDQDLQNLHFFGQARFPVSKIMFESFRQEAEKAGVRAGASWIEWKGHPNDLVQSSSYHQWVTALPRKVGAFCANDRIAVGVVNACRSLEIQVPSDVAVVGSNNDTILCRLTMPSLSSIVDSVEELGLWAARYLDVLLSGGRPEPHHRLVPPGELIMRSSSDLVRADSTPLAKALRMIHQNAEKNIGADDVVRSAHVCRRKLEYIFQKEFGHGIYQQILKVRVERSKVLLRNTDLPMIEIASRSGFGTVGRFEIAFRKFANCSPGNFRKSALQTAAGNANLSRRFESEEKS